MKKVVVIFSVLVFFIAECLCQHIILPTYRPPPKKNHIIRARRDISNEPVDKLQNGPHAVVYDYLPSFTERSLEPIARVERSLGTPSVSRGSSGSRSSSSRDTGPTHPGYNRRNARSVSDEPLWLYRDDDHPRAPANGDHPILSKFIDDIKLDENRRVARSLRDFPTLPPFNPKPRYPWDPESRTRFPILY